MGMFSIDENIESMTGKEIYSMLTKEQKEEIKNLISQEFDLHYCPDVSDSFMGQF